MNKTRQPIAVRNLLKKTTVVVMVCMSSQVTAQAAINGYVESLEEGYLLYQAVEACPLSVSGTSKNLVLEGIKKFEQETSDAEKTAIWKKVARQMPIARQIGICSSLQVEFQLIEEKKASENPVVPNKPKFD